MARRGWQRGRHLSASHKAAISRALKGRRSGAQKAAAVRSVGLAKSIVGTPGGKRAYRNMATRGGTYLPLEKGAVRITTRNGTNSGSMLFTSYSKYGRTGSRKIKMTNKLKAEKGVYISRPSVKLGRTTGGISRGMYRNTLRSIG